MKSKVRPIALVLASCALIPFGVHAQPSPEAIIVFDFHGQGSGSTSVLAVEDATRAAELNASRSGYSNCRLKGYTHWPDGILTYRANATVTCEKDTTPPPPPPPPPPRPAPTIHQPVRNGSDHTVSWSSDIPSRYVLDQAVSGQGWKERYKGEATSWTQRDAPVGNYEYRVRDLGGGTPSAYSQVVVIIVSNPPPTPNLPPAPTAVGPNHTVSWSVSAGADTYQLHRAGEDGVWGTMYQGPVTQWSAVDTPPGVYRYRVVACANSACSLPSADSVFRVMTDITPIVSLILN